MFFQTKGVLLYSENGQAMVEYALITVLVAVALVTASFSGTANEILKLYQFILTKVSAVL